MQRDGIIFFTATCRDWKPLLKKDDRKELILDSLKFLVKENRIWLYGFVIMNNHIHLLWRKKELWIHKDIQQMFLKYTAQKIKYDIIFSNPRELKSYQSTQIDRKYHFWKRRPYKAEMHTRKVADQKITYIHNNPVKAGYCDSATDYKFSSARFYELNEDNLGILTHYQEHIAR